MGSQRDRDRIKGACKSAGPNQSKRKKLTCKFGIFAEARNMVATDHRVDRNKRPW